MSEDFPTRRSQRQPAHVYRRRRIMATLLLFAVLLLLAGGVYGLVKFFAGDEDESPTPVPSASQSSPASESVSPAQNSASPSAGGESQKACKQGDLQISAATDEQNYPAGKNPKFSLEIRNISESDCSVNVGTSQQDFVVKQGDNTVFATSFCQVNPTDQQLVFVPDQSESAHYTWERLGVDSQCSKTVEDLEPGEYELVAKLGDLESEPAKFTLSNDEASDGAELSGDEED